MSISKRLVLLWRKRNGPFHGIAAFFSLVAEFVHELSMYLHRKIMRVSLGFEKHKNVLVKLFMMKRGRYNRPFLHIAAMLLLAFSVALAPFLAETYPVFSQSKAVKLDLTSTDQQSISVDNNVFETEVSTKPRSEIITYRVEKGDTVSTIAQKFSSPGNPISQDTIRWANDLKNDSITVGDDLKILPVSGISHKVQSGDTVYSIAKKYNTEAQKIVDFPFNEFANPETFSLVVGEILVVPDGIKPSEQPVIKRELYIAQGPVPVSGGGFTWPVRGGISQFPSFYHMALDITSPVGTPIVAANDGTVTKVSIGTWDGGYGTNVYVDKGDGTESHYAHMSGVNVSVGQSVKGGSTVVGWVGLTGRTTGAHLHFEILRGGSLVNPLPYLQ